MSCIGRGVVVLVIYKARLQVTPVIDTFKAAHARSVITRSRQCGFVEIENDMLANGYSTRLFTASIEHAKKGPISGTNTSINRTRVRSFSVHLFLKIPFLLL